MLWYSLEAIQRGASNEYPQRMFLCTNKKDIIWFPGGGRVWGRCCVSWSLGRPADIGLQLGKACYVILVAGKGRGGMFLLLLFLHFHSISSFFSVLLFHFLYYLFYLFSPFLWEMTQNDSQGFVMSLNPNTINIATLLSGAI